MTIRQLRRVRQLRAASTRVELSLDEVDVVTRGRVVERFIELEAELTKGDQTDLAALGAAIETESGLQRAGTSKLEAALAALDGSGDGREPDAKPPARSRKRAAGAHEAGEPETDDAAGKAEPRLVTGKTPGVLAEDTVAEAGRKVMRFHLARMLDREPGVRDGKDIEDIHKMRVATRRQRAAWRVFGEAFRKRRTKDYRDGLRDIARRLGAVRDLDVQLEGVDTYRADLPVTEQRALEPLIGSLAPASRRQPAPCSLRELDSGAYARFIDDYLDFVRTEGAAAKPVNAVGPAPCP